MSRYESTAAAGTKKQRRDTALPAARGMRRHDSLAVDSLGSDVKRRCPMCAAHGRADWNDGLCFARVRRAR